jgi:hypothetical protein
MTLTPDPRKVCTKERPYVKEPGVKQQWSHPDAVAYDGSCDCCDHYRCPNCGLDFKVELPE